jgi:Putative phage tail protein
MATVVLTAVGAQFGGPIGSAIGAAIGQQIDRAIFGGGKSREGPRLKELEVQTSSYGTQVPAIFGAMRVAGTVIWSTDLIERREKSGGGKGRPSTINYSYSVSFAVALSSRPVARVGRIWADGNLLRGAAGDFKTETGFRFHNGCGDQSPDPLLASAEATGQCPAYRDLAYAVFEDLQLADFGNRIPSLTFELFERDEAVPVSEIVTGASASAITGQSIETLSGYAVQGSDARAALGPIFSALPVFAYPVGDRLELRDWSAPAPEVLVENAAVSDGRARLDRPGRSRQADASAPAFVSIRHYEPERDFQAGVQGSRRLGGSRSELQIDLPASVSAPSAKRLADLQLLQRRTGLNGSTAVTPMTTHHIRAGDLLGGNARIVEVEHIRGSVRLAAQDMIGSNLPGLSMADPGRNQPQPDLAAGETRMLLIELPALSEEDPGRPIIAVAAAGTGPGWRRAALSLRDGDRWIDLGGTNGVAMMGMLVDELPPHSALLEDRSNRPVVRLLHDAMTLPTGTGDAFGFDAPTLWIGGELVRYGFAEKIGPRDYRLSGLLRGCFGTGDTALSHVAGGNILLLEPNALRILDAFPTSVGSTLEVEAMGIADAVPVGATLMLSGVAITPRPPVHGEVEWLANGDIQLAWKRRDRLVSAWSNGVDLPNNEGQLEFLVELSVDEVVRSSWTVFAPDLLVTAPELASLFVPSGSVVHFAISQVGRFARSSPLAIATIT